ncbi:MAG: Re/Si-specific NAD(P)(+) transhydrogenase subunit alpha [Gammaproteobacteria bacterium]|nr:Re/Si-specific NAD(P)(+) transhydrogenase subunit alpha [Gammaproteobacteria bacterium]
MRVGVPSETAAGEARVAATPETVRKLRTAGIEVAVAHDAGKQAFINDEAYRSAGAEIVTQAAAFAADIVCKVQKPSFDEIRQLKRGAVLIALLDPFVDDGTFDALAQQGIDTFALESIPRISRAQSMDVLSSQANIAGYRAVLEATTLYGRFFPMMMTSAGSAKPARVVVLGAGVAGLQAIATARRLGGQVWSYDVRPEVKEQILSLGAKFIEFDLGESGAGSGGYAKQLSEDAQKRQQQLLTEELKKADIIISTAQIPGRPAPVLITEDAVKGMRDGAVIVDLAAGSGGNCPLTEADKVVIKHGVVLCGITNFPSRMPTDASSFFARNVYNFLQLAIEQHDKLWRCKVDYLADEITAKTLMTHQGQVKAETSKMTKQRAGAQS